MCTAAEETNMEAILAVMNTTELVSPHTICHLPLAICRHARSTFITCLIFLACCRHKISLCRLRTPRIQSAMFRGVNKAIHNYDEVRI